ncbi:hypothetical protein AB6A40_000483 [Gnathostoma spinigerum]|uniref:Transmembrane protein 115 n=1 Tax=Gnathostoma spinigerum TaxID=75299 RepID=A0ABD6E8T7_9BILA
MFASRLSLKVPSVLELFSNRLMKVGSICLIVGSALSLITPIYNFFVLTSSRLFAFDIWRLFTHAFCERNPILLIWSLWCLYQSSSVIEPTWGISEFLRYIIIVQVLSSLFIAFGFFLSYTLWTAYAFFFVKISGCPSVCAAVFVAIKQYLPDSVICAAPFGRIKSTHLPALAVLFSTTFAICGIVRAISVLQILFGIQVAWVYLRFFQAHDDGEPRGDSSDHFTWATLFPSKLQPLAAVLSSFIFDILVRLKLCRPIVRHIDMEDLNSVSIVLPGLSSKDTERRRQKALRDLTERLSRLQQAEGTNWLSMDDDGVPQTSSTVTSETSVHTATEEMKSEPHDPTNESEEVSVQKNVDVEKNPDRTVLEV